MSVTAGKEQRCGQHFPAPRLRCDKPARHPGWHTATHDGTFARWLTDRSYEIHIPLMRSSQTSSAPVRGKDAT